MRWLTIALTFVAVAIAAGYAFLASEAGLRFAAQMLIARSDGRLDVEAPAGSLLSTVRVKRLVWRGPEATMTADEIALNWNPFALLSRGIVVQGARRAADHARDRSVRPAAPLPVSLALPTNVAIDEVAVANFDWAVGTNSGTIRGVTFGYSGGAHDASRGTSLARHGARHAHRQSGRSTHVAVRDQGRACVRRRPDAKGGARRHRPFRGRSTPSRSTRTGARATAQFTLRARLTPFAAVALDTLSLDARELDLAAWDAALPVTRLSRQGRGATGSPADSQVASMRRTRSRGRSTQQRLPVRSLRRALCLARRRAHARRRRRRARGRRSRHRARQRSAERRRGQVDARRARRRLAAALHAAGPDPALRHARRRSRRGRPADRRQCRGPNDRRRHRCVVRRDGRGSQARRRTLPASAPATGSSPAAVGSNSRADAHSRSPQRRSMSIPRASASFPRAALDGEIAASGELEPAWRVAAKVTIAAGSRLAGEPVAGTARALVSAHAIRDAAIDVKFASAKADGERKRGRGRRRAHDRARRAAARRIRGAPPSARSRAR